MRKLIASVSARELTRISLIADAFASVSKITTGYPYNDFTVTNEPVRGDIYISVPNGFAPGRVTFFATSKKGFVYKFTCKVAGDEAEQVFVSNPAIAGERAQSLGSQILSTRRGGPLDPGDGDERRARWLPGPAGGERADTRW